MPLRDHSVCIFCISFVLLHFFTGMYITVYMFPVTQKEMGRTQRIISYDFFFPSFSACLAIQTVLPKALFELYIKALSSHSALILYRNTARNVFLYPCFFPIYLYPHIRPLGLPLNPCPPLSFIVVLK